MNKTEKRAIINKQNKTEKTNTICPLINTDLFSGSGRWFCCKWKRAYDWLNICCNCCAYNFQVIAYQIVLHNCAQIISLNQMVRKSMLMMSKTNQLS